MSKKPKAKSQKTTDKSKSKIKKISVKDMKGKRGGSSPNEQCPVNHCGCERAK